MMTGGTYAQAQPSDSSSAAATAMRTSCRADYRARCSGNDPSAPIAAGCLSQYYLSLSKVCQAALDAYNNPQGDPERE